MKIALLTDGITPYVIGGMQRHSFYVAKYLARQGVYVDLFHFNQSNFDIHKLEYFSGEEKKYIRSVVIGFPKTKAFPGHYIYASYRYSNAVFDTLKNGLNEYQFIYVKGFSGWKLLNEKSKGLACPPIGTNFHGYEMFQKAPSLKAWPAQQLLKYFTLPLLQKSDKVFSYGGKITTLLTHTIGIPQNKIIEIPGGIEKEWLNNNPKPAHDTTRFIFVGRAERRKGIEELNSALVKIQDKHSFSFTFIGPIPTKKQIHAPNIRYVGEIKDPQKIREELAQHDILVCPSHSEGMPNVILEAMAYGLAIIASDVGAIQKMVDEKNGWLVNPNDKEQLENILLKAIHTPKNSLEEMQEKSIEKIREHFLWDKLITELISKIST